MDSNENLGGLWGRLMAISLCLFIFGFFCMGFFL